MQKLYCYVDENGLETKGRIFIVAAVVLDGEQAPVFAICEHLEKLSGKNRLKWGKAEHNARMNYLRFVFANEVLKGRLCYVVFRQTSNYELATVEGIALAIRRFAPSEKYTSMIYVDALSKNKRHEYSARIRKLGVPTHKVQGVTKDETNALVRLADAIAGFVRDALDYEKSEIRSLFQRAVAEGTLIDLSK